MSQHWSDADLPQSQQQGVFPVDQVAAIDRELKDIGDEKKRRGLNRIENYFPDAGPNRRELYPKHLAFFRAGKYYRSRLFSAGNRVGKTVAGSFEMALHLCGDLYPSWWDGRRFEEPIMAWAAGTTNETTKNILQTELLGKLEKDEKVSEGVIGMGTGMIPASRIAAVEFHPQIRGAIKTAWIRHASGRRSTLRFLSFEAGREAFEGVSVHFAHLDESPSLEIYTEVIMRTFTTDGAVIITATPLNGLTELVQQFMPDGVTPEWQQCKTCGKQLMEQGHTCPII